jgi:hypothetical protein
VLERYLDVVARYNQFSSEDPGRRRDRLTGGDKVVWEPRWSKGTTEVPR